MHDNFNFFILGAVAVIIIAALIYYYYFSPYAAAKRMLFKSIQKNIFSVENGETAKVTGTIKYIGSPLIAPLSGRKCVYYQVVVEEKKSTGKSSYWDTIIDEELAANVVIRDGNSYALIETNMIKSLLMYDKKYKSGFLNDATPELEKYLSKYGFKSTSSFLGINNTLRYKEGILEEGEMIAVVGKGAWKRKSEIKFDIPFEKILVIGHIDDKIPVFLSDDPASLQ